MDKLAIGIDIGGTNVRLGLVDMTGRVLKKKFLHFKDIKHTPAGSSPASSQVDFISSGLEDFLKEKGASHKVSMAGVGIAGQIEKKTGTVLFSPNLNWRAVPLRKILEQKTGLRVNVVNDLTAITYGEWKFGSGAGYKNLICIFIGTGIGSGIVAEGTLAAGCSDSSGEIGHTVIVSGGRKCPCGNRGCLEAYAGGTGIAKTARRKAAKDRKVFKNLISLAEGKIENITAETVARAYKKKDAAASMVVEKTAGFLSDGVINAVNFFNPCAVILGGGVIEGIPDLARMVEKQVRERALEASTKKLDILGPGLGGDSGIIGAAMLACSSYA